MGSLSSYVIYLYFLWRNEEWLSLTRMQQPIRTTSLLHIYSHLIFKLKWTKIFDYWMYKTTIKEVGIQVKWENSRQPMIGFKTKSWSIKMGGGKRWIYYLQEDGVGTWPATMPKYTYGITLSITEFRENYDWDTFSNFVRYLLTTMHAMWNLPHLTR